MNNSKKIFLTGASGGICSAICEKFNNEKFILVLTSSSEKNIEVLKNKYGNNHFYFKVDLSDPDNLQNC